MAKYELDIPDDENAKVLANAIDEVSGDGAFAKHTQELLKHAANEIRRQIPIPVPDKIGAVVRTEFRDSPGAIHPTDGVFVRWATDSRTVAPWVEANDSTQDPRRTDEIGRITEVLSQGADL